MNGHDEKHSKDIRYNVIILASVTHVFSENFRYECFSSSRLSPFSFLSKTKKKERMIRSIGFSGHSGFHMCFTGIV